MPRGLHWALAIPLVTFDALRALETAIGTHTALFRESKLSPKIEVLRERAQKLMQQP